MELHDLGEVVQGSGFGVFDSVLAAGGRVFGLAAPGHGGRDAVADRRPDRRSPSGPAPRAWCTCRSSRRVPSRSPILKFLGEGRAEQIVEAAGASPGDLVLIVADADIHAQEALGERARRSSRSSSVWSRTRTSCPTSGSTASRCTSGTPTTTAGTPRTTRSAASSPEDEELLDDHVG